jgi:hypothetical protein
MNLKIAVCLGKACSQTLGKCRWIRRYVLHPALAPVNALALWTSSGAGARWRGARPSATTPARRSVEVDEAGVDAATETRFFAKLTCAPSLLCESHPEGMSLDRAIGMP